MNIWNNQITKQTSYKRLTTSKNYKFSAHILACFRDYGDKNLSKLFSPEERLNYVEAFIKLNEKAINLDFWQARFLQDTSKFSVLLKSRRTGFSFIVALKGLVKALDKARYNYVRQFVSYNEEDAKEKILYAKMFYDAIPKKHKKRLISSTKTSLEFLDANNKTVSRLISIACRPPRGRGGDIVFDEMAIYPENKAGIIYTAGLPVIARGGCVEIGSTPLGKKGVFYDVFTNKERYNEYTRYTIPWWFANELCVDVEKAVKIAPEMESEERVKRFGSASIKTIFNSMFLEDFNQEFECVFVDNATSFISLELIHENTPGMRASDRGSFLIGGNLEKDVCIEEEKECEVNVFNDVDSLCLGYNKDKHGLLFVGYDVARYRDMAVIFVLGLLPNDKKIAVAEIEMTKKTFEYQRNQIRQIMKLLPVARCAVDRTGQGMDTTETLQREFGSSKIEGVNFNMASKEIMAIEVRASMERREFLLHNSIKFHKQIHSIKRIATSGGGFRYDATRDKTGHADSFWAFALANYAVVTKTRRQKLGFYQCWKMKKNAQLLETQGEENLSVEKQKKYKKQSLFALDRKWKPK